MLTLSPTHVTGILLVAIPLLLAHGLPAPTGTAVLQATGVARTTGYKAKSELTTLLQGASQPVARPPPEEVAPPDACSALHQAIVGFLFDHPGAVGGTAARRRYSDRYRCFVLDCWTEHRALGVAALAAAVGVPVPTLKEWLRGERPAVAPPESLATVREPTTAQIETVLAAWDAWDDKRAGLQAFCAHVWFHLRIPFWRQHISDLLSAHGVRTKKPRGRPMDASQRRRGFEKFFPGAQWVGDGAELVVYVQGERFTVNLELLVDAYSAAYTGATVSPTEDAAAVVQAFEDGVATTGARPLAVLLDNKPSNHGEQVQEALGETLLMRSRPYVPTDKPQVEGAFGLFSQEAPAMVLNGTDSAAIARELAALVFTTWARAVNHRPRVDRRGKTRAWLYNNDAPTAEQLAAAQAALLDRQQRQAKARLGRQRREDPIVRALLDAAFLRLELDDPDGRLRKAIASWPLESVMYGIAVFEGKKRAGTLPKDVDGRYLRGIVKNTAETSEGMAIAEALLRERMAARDLALEHLGKQQEALQADVVDPRDLVNAFVDKALAAPRRIDRLFWLLATADVIVDDEPEQHRVHLRCAARRIHSTFAVPHKERLFATRFLFAKVIPIG